MPGLPGRWMLLMARRTSGLPRRGARRMTAIKAPPQRPQHGEADRRAAEIICGDDGVFVPDERQARGGRDDGRDRRDVVDRRPAVLRRHNGAEQDRAGHVAGAAQGPDCEHQRDQNAEHRGNGERCRMQPGPGSVSAGRRPGSPPRPPAAGRRCRGRWRAPDRSASGSGTGRSGRWCRRRRRGI